MTAWLKRSTRDNPGHACSACGSPDICSTWRAPRSRDALAPTSDSRPVRTGASSPGSATYRETPPGKGRVEIELNDGTIFTDVGVITEIHGDPAISPWGMLEMRSAPARAVNVVGERYRVPEISWDDEVAHPVDRATMLDRSVGSLLAEALGDGLGPRLDSPGNGAAMRVAPVGLVHALDRSSTAMLADAVLFALPTHGGAVGVVGAVAMAAGVGYLARRAVACEGSFSPRTFVDSLADASAKLAPGPAPSRSKAFPRR